MKKAILPAIAGLGIAVAALLGTSAVASAEVVHPAEVVSVVSPAAFGVEQPTWMGPIRCDLPWNWDRPECWWLHHRRFEERWRPGFGGPGFGGPGFGGPGFGRGPGFGHGPGFGGHPCGPGFGGHGGFGHGRR